MISFCNQDSELYFPDEPGDETRLKRTTHLGIGAHPDDLEIFAIHGILEAYDDPKAYFTGVTVTNGIGAPPSAFTSSLSTNELWKTRVDEQKEAAEIGHYNAQFLLNYHSKVIKTDESKAIIEDLKLIIRATRPSMIYTHNLADKHDTHVAVALSVIQALREIKTNLDNVTLLGCEVWRNLDWLPDNYKISLDVSKHFSLQKSLLSVYRSQILEGKNYLLATEGRRIANATFYQYNELDQADRIVYAMDLTPLISTPGLNIEQYVSKTIQNFEKDVRERLNRLRIHSK